MTNNANKATEISIPKKNPTSIRFKYSLYLQIIEINPIPIIIKTRSWTNALNALGIDFKPIPKAANILTGDVEIRPPVEVY